MRPLFSKRIGQSNAEFLAAVLFSLITHAIVIVAALLLFAQSPVRERIPPAYRVNLVAAPADAPALPESPEAAAPAPPAPPKTKPSAARRAKTTAPKGAMPELDRPKAGEEPPAPQESGAAKQAVAVASTTQEFKFPPYLAVVRDKVERNWSPPPGAKGTKATVVFKVLRSGRVGEARLEQSSGNFYFDQAAMRAIHASSPFPPLPEGFFKDHEVFSVDLMEQE